MVLVPTHHPQPAKSTGPCTAALHFKCQIRIQAERIDRTTLLPRGCRYSGSVPRSTYILQRLSVATASQREISLARSSSDISYKIHFSGPTVQGNAFDKMVQTWLENTVSQMSSTVLYATTLSCMQPLTITFRTMTRLLRIRVCKSSQVKVSCSQTTRM